MRLQFSEEKGQASEYRWQPSGAGYVRAGGSVDSLAEKYAEERKKPKMYGNYRGSRYLIVKDEGAYLTLARSLKGKTIVVSRCNVTDISTSPTTAEKVCTGDNECRRSGIRQGPRCTPIRPDEGILRYPAPI